VGHGPTDLSEDATMWQVKDMPERPKDLFDARYRAFLETVSDVRAPLHRYCARMTGSRLDGEDLVQETLFEAYTKIETLDDAHKLKSWLFRIAHNRCIDFLRRRGARERAESAYSGDIAAVAAEPAMTGAHRAIERLVGHLPPKERACVLLKDVFDYSLEETAALVDSSVGGVKSALAADGRSSRTCTLNLPANRAYGLIPTPHGYCSATLSSSTAMTGMACEASPAPMLGCGSPIASTACSKTLPISTSMSETQTSGPWSWGRSTESLSCSCSSSMATAGRSPGRFASTSQAASSIALRTITPVRGSLEALLTPT